MSGTPLEKPVQHRDGLPGLASFQPEPSAGQVHHLQRGIQHLGAIKVFKRLLTSAMLALQFRALEVKECITGRLLYLPGGLLDLLVKIAMKGDRGDDDCSDNPHSLSLLD